jgi:hypothetical protein
MKRLMAELGDHFIGLWRYRVYGERRYYICTFEINGDYYDSRQRVTPEAALREALKTLEAERRKRENRARAAGSTTLLRQVRERSRKKTTSR